VGHPEGGLPAHWSCVRGGYRLPQSGDGERDGNLDRVYLGIWATLAWLPTIAARRGAGDRKSDRRRLIPLGPRLFVRSLRSSPPTVIPFSFYSSVEAISCPVEAIGECAVTTQLLRCYNRGNS